MGAEAAGWTITGFQAVIALWAWASIVLLHVVWRSFQGPETDPVRTTGPIH